jgi:thymidylate synthase (FAD)
MKVTLIPAGTSMKDPEAHIGHMAAICYDSDTAIDACRRRANKCKDSGHLATMRFAFATFNVSEISRICSHQIVRMAHAGLLQRSQRYVKETGVRFIRPPALLAMPIEMQDRWEALENESASLYLAAIAAGMKKEDARYSLLHSAETELNMCLNFQAWQDFLRNRTYKAAQWEVREVALEIQRQLHELAPNLFPLPKNEAVQNAAG